MLHHRSLGHIIKLPTVEAPQRGPLLRNGQFFFVYQYFRGVARGASWGALDTPFVSHGLSRQPSTGGKNNMKSGEKPRFCTV